MAPVHEILQYAAHLVEQREYRRALEIISNVCNTRATKLVCSDCRHCALETAALELKKRVAS